MARERGCTATVRRGRLRKERSFADAAALVTDLVEDEHDLADALVTL